MGRGPEPGVAPESVRGDQARVAERLRAIDRARVVPLGRLRSAWPLLTALVALISFARFWPAGLERGWAALTSAEPPPATSSEPIVADVELTLRYPAYTELPPRVIPGTSGHVLALPGTQVAVAARALVSVGSAALLVESERGPARELPLDLRHGPLAPTFHVPPP